MAAVFDDGTANGSERMSYSTFGARVPALRSFYLRYVSPGYHDIVHMQVVAGGASHGDHEIRGIGIDRRGNDFTVHYVDNDANDRFAWRIEWAHISPEALTPLEALEAGAVSNEHR